MTAFVAFWREQGEWMVRGQKWPEAAHQIVLMAFLQRVVNGGGVIDREYALGTRRLDLLIRWFVEVDRYGAPRKQDLHAIEVKVWRDTTRSDPIVEGKAQLDAYLGRLVLDTGTLLVFDARASAPSGDAWEQRGAFTDEATPAGRPIRVYRL